MHRPELGGGFTRVLGAWTHLNSVRLGKLVNANEGRLAVAGPEPIHPGPGHLSTWTFGHEVQLMPRIQRMEL